MSVSSAPVMKGTFARRVGRLLVAVAVMGISSAGCGNGGSESGEAADEHAEHQEAAEAEGLSSAKNGVRLDVTKTSLGMGPQPFSFRIVEDGGKPVTDFEVEQERELHLIVVRRDLTGFQHLHPKRAPDGTWTVPIGFEERGAYRVFADFVPAGGEQTVLGVDVEVAGGKFSPEPLPDPETAVSAGEYDVRVDAGEIEAEGAGELTLEITKGGAPVGDLQPYLGALGHAVVVREGDLAYLHAHPLSKTPSPDGALQFHVALPTASRYRAFVQFRHDGSVQLASFTIAHA